MSADSAAEIRRQRILQNANKRMNMLLGTKKETDSTHPVTDELTESSYSNISSLLKEASEDITASMTRSSFHDRARIPIEVPESSNLTATSEKPASEAAATTTTNSDTSNTLNGHSNSEILFMFILAFITALLFRLDLADLILKNALLPFFTYQIVHITVNFNSIQSTRSQLNVFKTVLQLGGVSQSATRRLLNSINFVFIAIDNFVLYIASFTLVYLVLFSI